MVTTEATSEENASSHSSHNPILAAFVTSYARRVLFEGLVQCGRRALYCDTDSIIFISDPDKFKTEPKIDSLPVLGSWVDELKPGTFIRVKFSLPPSL